jgi:hypothetical protein
MDRRQALIEVLKGKIVYCKDTNQKIGYVIHGKGFYELGGAEDGFDCGLDVSELPHDATFILLED